MNIKLGGVFIALVMVIGYFILEISVTFGELLSLTGKDVYRLNCTSCHGSDRTGYTNIYPSLINIKERFSKEEVLQQINSGKGQMPSFSHLTLKEREALIAFLFGEQEITFKNPVENLGEKIFKSNCASCHQATTNDPKPPNVRMMEPAPLAGASKRFKKKEFFRILETGVCYMPSFTHFSSEEKESLYIFIKSLKGKGEPSRPTMGEMCPMMVRMIKVRK